MLKNKIYQAPTAYCFICGQSSVFCGSITTPEYDVEPVDFDEI